MPRLPGKPDLGQLPSARTGRGIARPDSSGFTQGVKDLGRGISQFGAGIHKAANDVDPAQKFEAESRFQEFKWNEKLELDEAMRSMEPGQAGSFANSWADGYTEKAKQFKSTLPEPLKPEYDNKLFGAERELYGSAATFARGEQKRYSLNRIEDFKNTYGSRAHAGEPLDGIRSDFEGLVGANPFLTPIEKDEAIRKGYAGLEESHVLGRVERGDNLNEILKDLHGRRTDGDDQEPQRPDSRATISFELETGSSDPLVGITNISRDAGGTKSYGNFGLNSQAGGSIFQFAKEYGKQFGLTAKPGTKAFDDQWRMAATANPDDLHAAEMAWHSENITEGIKGKLTKAGVPSDIADDPRVQTYFADRMVQQGPGSIDGMQKHAKRIKAASDNAGGDVVMFLEAITEADRDALTSDFPTALRTGVYSAEGHDTRLNGRLSTALGATSELEGQSNYLGPYKHLSSDRRRTLVGKAKIASRTKATQQAKDSIEEIRNEGVVTLDENGENALERAERVLTRKQFTDLKADWQEAELEYQAFNDITSLTEPELDDRLQGIEPKVGEDLYEIKSKLYDRALRKIEGIRDLREKDPARSISDLPDVQIAEQGVRENPGDPQFIQQLASARIDAQQKVGIPEGLQSPITKQEARVLLAPTKGLEGQALYDSLTGVQESLNEQYGPYARVAAARAFEYDNRSGETAEALESVLHTAFEGLQPSASQVRRLELLSEVDRATRAFVDRPYQQLQGQPAEETGMPFQVDPANAYRMRKPPKAAVDALIANPELRDQFEEFYGSGSAEQFLSR